MLIKKFASQGDLTEKKISFNEIGKDIWAFTAEGDPNTGVIIGDDSVMVVDAQATPRLANMVVEKIRTVTDKPIKYVTPLAITTRFGFWGLQLTVLRKLSHRKNAVQ